ncbi:hypothetical protein ISCGN_007404 [Ixodes scapularis]
MAAISREVNGPSTWLHRFNPGKRPRLYSPRSSGHDYQRGDGRTKTRTLCWPLKHSTAAQRRRALKVQTPAPNPSGPGADPRRDLAPAAEPDPGRDGGCSNNGRRRKLKPENQGAPVQRPRR